MLSALFIACLAAAAPGVIVLQVLPRLAASDASSITQAALGTLLPLGGALLGGLLLRAMTHRSAWVGAALGLAAQAAGVPEFVSIFSGTVALGYLLDTGVYTALFGSYVVLGGALATLAAGPASVPSTAMSPREPTFGEEEELSSPPVWESVSRRPEPAKREGSNLRWWAQVLCAVILLVTAVPTLGNLAAPLLYPLSMSLAAAALAAYASAERAGWQRRAALVALVVAAAVAAFITVLLAGTLAG